MMARTPAGAMASDVPAPTRASVPAQTSTGQTGWMLWATVTWSGALPSCDRAVTCHDTAFWFSGAVRFQAIGTAPPAGMVTVSGLPVAIFGVRSTLAVPVIGIDEPFLSEKLSLIH